MNTYQGGDAVEDQRATVAAFLRWARANIPDCPGQRFAEHGITAAAWRWLEEQAKTGWPGVGSEGK